MTSRVKGILFTGLLASLALLAGCLEEQLNTDVRQQTANVELVNQWNMLIVKIQENDVSVLINLRAVDDSKQLGITSIRAPDGEMIYDTDVNFNVTSEFVSDPYVGEGEIAAFLPPTPRLTLQPGNYIVNLWREDNVEISSAVLHIKSTLPGEDIDSLAFVFDLNVWVVHPDPAYRGEEFQSLFLASYKDTLDDILDSHNMSIGAINFYNAQDDHVAAFGNLNVDTDLKSACRALSSLTGAGLSLNLGFTRSLVSEDGGELAGISTGLPGLIMDSSAGSTCFFAAQEAFVENAAAGVTAQEADQLQAITVIHEAGHFMSLFHPTESDGLFFDLIDDTAECDLQTFDGRDNEVFGVPGELDGEIADHECSFEGGADNFLFYAGHDDFLPFKISDDQAWVLRRHPLALRVE